MMDQALYVVASSKDWNRAHFDALAKAPSQRWLYAGNQDELAEILRHESPRYIFFMHWNWRVPQALWERVECVCFHMTDVPYGRGGSPLQNLIAAGHAQTVVSALRMVEEMDAGPVYAKYPLSLEGRAEEIYLRAGAVCLDIIGWMVAVNPQPVPQMGEAVVFKRRQPAQSELPDQGELRALYDHIRMLDAPGYPLAFVEHGDFRLEFAQARLTQDEIQTQVVIRKKPQA